MSRSATNLHFLVYESVTAEAIAGPSARRTVKEGCKIRRRHPHRRFQIGDVLGRKPERLNVLEALNRGKEEMRETAAFGIVGSARASRTASAPPALAHAPQRECVCIPRAIFLSSSCRSPSHVGAADTHFFKPAKDRKMPLEGVFAKKQIKDRVLVHATALPLSVCHR